MVRLPAVMSEVHTSPSAGDLCGGLFSDRSLHSGEDCVLAFRFGGIGRVCGPPAQENLTLEGSGAAPAQKA